MRVVREDDVAVVLGCVRVESGFFLFMQGEKKNRVCGTGCARVCQGRGQAVVRVVNQGEHLIAT